MRRRLAAAFLLACLSTALFAGVQAGSAKPVPSGPSGFFGIAPQTPLTIEDARYMKAGGIESIRVSMPWSAVEPTRKGGYDWRGIDPTISIAARAGLKILPFVYSAPRWAAGKETTLPVGNPARQAAWTAFLRAAVLRYGPGGTFWSEKAPGVVQYEPAIPRPAPIRTWQVWNEANFFYFAYPVSPSRYAQLLTLSSKAIKRADPSAKVVMSGLFGDPTTGGKRGMPAAEFLRGVYRTPGIKSRFDGIALHPYAVDAETLEELVEELHEVTVEEHDRPALHITELGWGSEPNFKQVAFEQGPQGQAKQLRESYGYMLENQGRLNLKSAYWFSWKDLPGSCDFCDSVGFFREGPKFKPKPAWHAFVAIAGGRARP
jgi:hypothetical protein